MKFSSPDQVTPSLSRTRPILIAGPTASGKSALALALAKRDGRLIINADALQVYGRWRILSARPTVEEEAQIDHRLYGHVGRDEAYSVGHWLRDVAKILATDQPIVIVGGTGLNFTALTQGLADIPVTSAQVRATADARRATEGISALLAELDAETAAQIDPANPARVQRAWEVLHTTGRGLAAWQAQTGPALIPVTSADTVALQPGADWLNARIDARFDAMVADGVLDEVAAELPYWDPNQASSRAIGAPELIAHLRGDISLDVAIAQSKLASRQYAKRQRTWLRSRMSGWQAVTLP